MKDICPNWTGDHLFFVNGHVDDTEHKLEVKSLECKERFVSNSAESLDFYFFKYTEVFIWNFDLDFICVAMF